MMLYISLIFNRMVEFLKPKSRVKKLKELIDRIPDAELLQIITDSIDLKTFRTMLEYSAIDWYNQRLILNPYKFGYIISSCLDHRMFKQKLKQVIERVSEQHS